MHADQIIKQIYAWKKITLSFPNAEEREKCRQRIYKGKRNQDKAIRDILGEGKDVLKTSLFEKGNEFLISFWLEEKNEVSFNVVGVEDLISQGKEKDGSGNNPTTTDSKV